jgi:hypothetical protein
MRDTRYVNSMITKRLKQAVEQAAAVLPAEEQDVLAGLLLRLAEEQSALAKLAAMLEADDDAKWDTAFAADWEKFDRLAENARADIAAGKATPLDPDKL